MDSAEHPTTVASLSGGQVEYRLERRGDAAVVIFHGGHMRAGLALGEDVFADAGNTVLVPSRPGYGRTPLSTGRSVAEFSDVVRALGTQLGISKVAAVVGISGGGPTAVTMAARHPDLVERVLLLSSVAWLRWPDRGTRIGAHLVFAAATERVTWSIVRALARRAPDACLRLLLRDLSTRPVGDVVAALQPDHRSTLLTLFGQMRSGRGFVHDLRPTPDLTAGVGQPTLVVATRNDGAVSFAHAQALAGAIRNAELVESQADSHFIWHGQDWPAIAQRVRTFLRSDPQRRQPPAG